MSLRHKFDDNVKGDRKLLTIPKQRSAFVCFANLRVYNAAHILLEKRKLQLAVKKRVYTGVDFYVQNAPKLIYEHN